jgi:hypothetical protein
MKAYSSETRIELTPLGWQYVANHRLRKKSNPQSETTATFLKERAKTAIRAAQRGMETDHPATPVQ